MTVAYFMVQNDGGQVISPADVLVVTGRALASVTATTGTDKAGSYYDGMGWSNSATFVGGASLFGKQIMLLADDGGALKMTAYMVDDSVKGKRLSAASIYRENAADDGICAEVINGSPVYFTKYSATIV